MANEYWLNDEQWQAIEPLIPTRRRGVKPGRNRQVKSTARTRRSIIALIDGRRRAFGRACCSN